MTLQQHFDQYLRAAHPAQTPVYGSLLYAQLRHAYYMGALKTLCDETPSLEADILAWVDEQKAAQSRLQVH